jgi:EpsI family protein
MKISAVCRVLIFCILLVAGAGVMARTYETAPIPPREPLSALPLELGSWGGQSLGELSDNAREMLQVDDYLNRQYTNSEGASVGLYVGYHIAGGFHSPLNCLPGSGWIPVKKSYLDIPVASPSGDKKASIHVNRIVILRGADKQVVLYWYQGCGRIIASEYWGLIYGMVDKMRLGRTDAALVRIMAPAQSLDAAAEETAAKSAVDFAKMVYPVLNRYIPD